MKNLNVHLKNVHRVFQKMINVHLIKFSTYIQIQMFNKYLENVQSVFEKCSTCIQKKEKIITNRKAKENQIGKSIRKHRKKR